MPRVKTFAQMRKELLTEHVDRFAVLCFTPDPNHFDLMAWHPTRQEAMVEAEGWARLLDYQGMPATSGMHYEVVSERGDVQKIYSYLSFIGRGSGR